MNSKHSIRHIATLLVVCMVLGSGPALILAQEGPDIQGHWAEEAVNRWTHRGIVEGYPDGTFKPGNSITRAEFAALVNRTFGYATFSSVEFSDVNDDEWFAGDVSKAVGAGYIEGYPDGTFKPNENISRQEAALVLARINDLEKTGEVYDFTDMTPFLNGACGQ